MMDLELAAEMGIANSDHDRAFQAAPPPSQITEVLGGVAVLTFV